MDQNQGNSGSEETRKNHERDRLIAEISGILQEEHDEVLQGMVKFVKAVKEDTGTKRELMNFHKNGFAILLLQTGSTPGPNQQNASSFSSSSSPITTSTTSGQTPCLSSSSKKICVEPGIIGGNCTNVSIETDRQSEAIASSSSSHTADQAHARSTFPNVSAKPQMNQHTNANPLQNDYILRRIFEFCAVDCLKNSRLVSTKWRDACFDAWRKRAVLQVCAMRINVVTAADITQDNFRLRTKPFNSYRMELFEHDYDESEISSRGVSALLMQQIFRDLTPSIRYLDLDVSATSFVKWIPIIFTKLFAVRHFALRAGDFVGTKQIVQSLHNLQIQPHLNLKVFDFYYREKFINDHGSGDTLTAWNGIFTNFPNMEILRLKYYGRGRSNLKNAASTYKDVIGKIVTALHSVRAEKNFATLNLKELCIIGNYDACLTNLPVEVVEAVVNCKFPLERLIMDFGSMTSDSTFLSLLQAHSETLEYLEAIRAPHTSFLETRIPYFLTYRTQSKISLMKLKELHLPDGLAWGICALSSLNVPNLEKLIIENAKLRDGGLIKGIYYESDSDDDNDKIDRFNFLLGPNLVDHIDDSFPLETFLQRFDLPKLDKFFYAGGKEFGMSELKALALTMPNLTYLGVHIDKAVTIEDLTTLWPNLLQYENKNRGKWCKPREN